MQRGDKQKMKAKARYYKGIEFVVLAELPANQRILLESTPSEPERIKILIDGKITEDCIQYKHYTEWYSLVYATSVAPVTVESMPVNVGVPAISKA